MMLDHLTYNFAFMSEMSYNYYDAPAAFLSLCSLAETWWMSDIRGVLRLGVICIFFSLSGICSSFSKSNALRGVKLAVASVALSLFTMLADEFFGLGITIVFGVIHCFAISVIIYALLDFLLKGRSAAACVGLGALLFVWGLLVNFYYLQFNAHVYPPYSFTEMLKIVFGTAYSGSDCFGIIPYTGIFLIGAGGGKLLYANRKAYLPVFGKPAFKPVRFVGKYALWFYLFHQIVMFFLVMAIAYSLGLRYY